MKKEHSIILLPTSEISSIWKNVQHDTLWTVDDYTIREAVRNNQTEDYQYLYVLSNEDIEEGDQCYHDEWKKIVQCTSKGMGSWHHLKKVIASTDPKISYIPKEPSSVVQQAMRDVMKDVIPPKAIRMER